MTYDSRKSEYNTFENFPKLSANCINYLIDNEEVIWRLLKYNTSDAWNKSNLTKVEKGALIYSGQPEQTDYRVFMDIGQDVPWDIEACVLRISPVELNPTNHIYGNVSMLFEVYSHYKIEHMSNYQVRSNMAIQRIIETFNGAEIGGLGRLYFDFSVSSKCRTILVGQIPMRGVAAVMCNWITS